MSELLLKAATAVKRTGYRWGMNTMITGCDDFSFALAGLLRKLGAASVLMCCSTDEEAQKAENAGFKSYKYGNDIMETVKAVTGPHCFDIVFEVTGKSDAWDIILDKAVKRGGTVAVMARLPEPYTCYIRSSVRSQIRFLGINSIDADAEKLVETFTKGA